MKVTSVLQAEAVRPIVVVGPVYLPDVLSSLKERYGLVQGPSPREALTGNPDAGIVLSHGKWLADGQRTVLIRDIKIMRQAIAIDTALSTDDSELLFADLLVWAESLGLKAAQYAPQKRAYSSRFEFTLNLDLGSRFPKLDQVGNLIASSLTRYNWHDQELPRLRVHSIGMNLDPSKLPILTEFRVERRVNIPYDQNVYFSQAPLTTADHIAVLEEFERAMGEAANHSPAHTEASIGAILRNKSS